MRCCLLGCLFWVSIWQVAKSYILHLLLHKVKTNLNHNRNGMIPHFLFYSCLSTATDPAFDQPPLFSFILTTMKAGSGNTFIRQPPPPQTWSLCGACAKELSAHTARPWWWINLPNLRLRKNTWPHLSKYTTPKLRAKSRYWSQRTVHVIRTTNKHTCGKIFAEHTKRH